MNMFVFKKTFYVYQALKTNWPFQINSIKAYKIGNKIISTNLNIKVPFNTENATNFSNYLDLNTFDYPNK